ncbi:MAG: hypothetical protein IKL85_10100 [Lentisphaeria bacterium]|nr:hypothetical protein [Lentisphaeria bacterium]
MEPIKFFACAAAVACGVVSHAGSGEIPFRREVAEAASKIRQTRTLDKVWVYAERQPYTAGQNFMWHYIDRPLFTDVSVRRARQKDQKAAFRNEIDILKWSGFDGFGMIAHPYITGRWFKWLADEPAEGYGQMPVLHNFSAKPSRKNRAYADMKRMILVAAKCPSAPRIDGKLVVWGWGNVADKQCGWVKLLREDPEIPPFIYLCELPFLRMYVKYGELKEGEKLPDELVRQYQADLVERLEYCDGFKIRCHEFFFRNGEYPARVLPLGLCEKYLNPLTIEVMNRPEYKGRKYLGAYVEQAYINHLNGPTHGQYGTECLRTFMDGAVKMNVDFVMAFEWNEANENTSFQPMLSSSDAIARIMGFYRSRLDGTEPRPRAGDDVTVPNLILSTRQKMRLGESYHAEMMYVPDGSDTAPFEARVVLTSAGGKVLCSFPWERLPVTNLTAFSYYVPSERFSREMAVVPRLETRTGGKVKTWTGFDCTRFDPTWCNRFLYSRQSLRMLAVPSEAGLEVEKSGAGGFGIRAAYSGKENLASLEILDGCEEMRSYDRENEFDRSKYDVFKMLISSRDNHNLAKGTFDIPGVSDWKMRGAGIPWFGFSVEGVEAKGRPRKASFMVAEHHHVLIAVAKSETGKARLVFDFDKLPGMPPVDLGKIRDLGFYALTLPNHVRFEFERLDGLCDYPVHIDSPSAKMDVHVVSRNRFPVYQLRAVTKSGKVWRSAPVVPELPSGPDRVIETSSDFERKTVPMSVSASRIPCFTYDIGDVSHGDWLVARGAERRWNAALGGGWMMPRPMRHNAKQKHPPTFTNSIPVIAVEDGAPAIRFDGTGQYISLPQEFIPVASGYSLEFEIKPDDDGNRVLLRMSHSGVHETTLRLVTENGSVMLSYFGRQLVPRHLRHRGKLRVGEWNRIKVAKSANVIVCTVNGEKAVLPYNRRGRTFQTAVFGSNVAPGAEIPADIKPFKGYLRNLSIRHGIDTANP